MIPLRIHYLTIDGARCGIPLAANTTIDPKKVTCKTCRRLLSGEVK